MLFPTAEFALFFIVVFALNWLLMPRRRAWKAFIILASYVFYGLWDYRFLALLAGVTLINQAVVAAMERARSSRGRRWWLVLGVGANLAALGWFKFYGFFVTSVSDALESIRLTPSLPLLELVVPVGISFLVFRAITYVVDVYRHDAAPASVADVAIYMSFFPYMLAGPIVRASEFLPQLRGARDQRRLDVGRAFFLILIGLVKKVVIADFLARSLVDGVFDSPGEYSGLETLLGIYGYAVQIFCDFSGYTDIAIGVALLLGFRFSDNFNAPYTATSLQDFWRRWHMTLSRFLRDYLYIPLGGSRGSFFATDRNIMATMLLGGLWHGAGWTFAVWGGLHGLGLVVERFFRRSAQRRGPRQHHDGGQEGRSAAGAPSPRIVKWVKRALVFNFVCLLWVFFRAETMDDAGRVLARLAGGWTMAGAVTPLVLLAIAVGIGAQYVPTRVTATLEMRFSHLNVLFQALVVGVGLFLLSVFGPQGVSEFIYFGF